MALGLVLIAMLGAASASVALFVYQYPLWLVALAYPVTGMVILLPGVLLVAWVRHNPPNAGDMVTSRSPGAPHPQSQTGSSNP